MLEGKKREAAVRGARKLAELDTPENEIAATLQELGISNEDAKAVMAEAKKAMAQDGQPKAAAVETKKEIVQEETGSHDVGAEAGTKAPIRPERSGKKEQPFWKKILPVKHNYIPQLRTGGRAKVKEILAESPLEGE